MESLVPSYKSKEQHEDRHGPQALPRQKKSSAKRNVPEKQPSMAKQNHPKNGLPFLIGSLGPRRCIFPEIQLTTVTFVGIRWVPGFFKKTSNKKTLPGSPKVCFLEVFCCLEPTKKHGTFGSLGRDSSFSKVWSGSMFFIAGLSY